jgi:hypothetical protein
MKIETINVIELLDGEVIQLVAFAGDTAEEESKAMFRQLILEHNDPDNVPPQNVLGFEEESLAQMWKNGRYDDENGYVLLAVYSSRLKKNELTTQ